jgi:hypothetical protein
LRPGRRPASMPPWTGPASAASGPTRGAICRRAVAGSTSAAAGSTPSA